MTEPAANRQRHIVLPCTYTREPFISPSSGGGAAPFLPARDRQTHGDMLLAQLQQVKAEATHAHVAQNAFGMQSGVGVQVEFVGQPDVPLAFESLSYEAGRDPTRRIELLSVHVDEDIASANVFVPDGKLTHFENYLQPASRR